MSSNIGATEHHQFYGSDPAGSSLATLATNLSGNANFSTGPLCIYANNFAYGEPYTVMVTCDIRFGSNPAGYIFARYGGTTGQGVRYNGATGLQIVVNNAVAHTLTVPGSGNYEIAIHWSMEDDPLSPGDIRSEVRVWDIGGDAFLDGVSWTHTAPSVSGDHITFGAQVPAGTNSAGTGLTGAGVLLHATSEIQTYRDTITAAAAPTLTGDTAMESPVPDWSSGVGDHGREVGATHALAAQAVNANRLITGSPLVNIWWDDPDYVVESGSTPDEWFTASPDGTTNLVLGWLWRRPVPLVFNKCKCRVFVASDNSDPAEENDLVLSVWSCNRNPGVDSATPLESYYVTETLSNINDSDGQWLEFESDLRISRTEDNDSTWLAVSISVTGDSAATQHTYIRSVIIEPISVTETDAIGAIGNV